LKIKSERQFWSGVMFAVVGAAFTWGATDYSMGTSARPGPGYFPLLLGVLLAIIGAWIAITGLAGDVQEEERIGAIVWRPLLVIVASIVFFGLALPRLGMAVTAPLLIVGSSFAGEEQKWRSLLASAVVLTFFSWLVFVVGLKLVIPMWPAGL
jgi:hypothetical protein